MPHGRLALTPLLALAAACATTSPAPGRAPRAGDANILTAADLGRTGSATLLQALANQVPAMQVLQKPGQPCPSIVLRGTKTILGSSDPGIYVDGTPAVDTCILQQLRVHDVDRVEVYPSGIARTPGYRPEPYGLILVFLRDEDSQR